MTVIIKKKSRKKDLEKLLDNSKSQKPRKALDAKKYFGILKLKGDPVKIQRKLRNEWK